MKPVFTISALIGACLVVCAPATVSGQKTARVAKKLGFQCTRRMDVADWRIMLKDIKAVNPQIAARLETEAEFRKSQEDNIRQLFALACEAVKDGALRDESNKAELENIRAETTAVKFDQLADKKEGTPPFSSIGDDRIAAFYKLAGNETKFENFLKIKLILLKRANPELPDEVAPEQREEARKVFARISIRDSESRAKAKKLQADFWQVNALQVKLQQAQFLSRLSSEKVADETRVTDGEIDIYIAAHPEFDDSEQRTKAEGILARAAAGEDFGALANEYSEDPGNAGPQGKAGGLYKDVPLGQMIPEFEQAALALEPGKVAPQLVETVYGFHVIKLDRKGGTPQTYDVRHILLSTTMKDPANPQGREIPVKTFVRNKLEDERQSAVLAALAATNNIYIAPMPVGSAAKTKPAAKRRPQRRK